MLCYEISIINVAVLLSGKNSCHRLWRLTFCNTHSTCTVSQFSEKYGTHFSSVPTICPAHMNKASTYTKRLVVHLSESYTPPELFQAVRYSCIGIVWLVNAKYCRYVQYNMFKASKVPVHVERFFSAKKIFHGSCGVFSQKHESYVRNECFLESRTLTQKCAFNRFEHFMTYLEDFFTKNLQEHFIVCKEHPEQ